MVRVPLRDSLTGRPRRMKTRLLHGYNARKQLELIQAPGLELEKEEGEITKG
jgi:hypothetical protein